MVLSLSCSKPMTLHDLPRQKEYQHWPNPKSSSSNPKRFLRPFSECSFSSSLYCVLQSVSGAVYMLHQYCGWRRDWHIERTTLVLITPLGHHDIGQDRLTSRRGILTIVESARVATVVGPVVRVWVAQAVVKATLALEFFCDGTPRQADDKKVCKNITDLPA